MIKKCLLIIISCFAVLTSKGQNETVFIVNYLPAISLGKTADFTDNFSPRGVDFEANKFLTEDLSIGLVVSWIVFRQKISGETFEYRDLTITGTQFRYTNVAPININVKKYFLSEGGIAPYAGIGLGTNYAKQTNDIGVFTLSDDKWQFNMAPEVGMLYRIGIGTVLSLKLKYSYSPKAGDFPSTSFVNIGVGIGVE